MIERVRARAVELIAATAAKIGDRPDLMIQRPKSIAYVFRVLRREFNLDDETLRRAISSIRATDLPRLDVPLKRSRPPLKGHEPGKARGLWVSRSSLLSWFATINERCTPELLDIASDHLRWNRNLTINVLAAAETYGLLSYAQGFWQATEDYEPGVWPMLSLGVDPGYARLGLAVVDAAPNRYIVRDTREVVTHADDDPKDRMRAIWDAVGKLIRTWHPQIVAIEDQSGVAVGIRRAMAAQHPDKTHGWGASNAKVDEVVGLLKGACLAYGADYMLISPRSIKVSLLGSGAGRAKKEQMVRAASQFYPGGRITSEHVADAVGTAIAGHQHFRTPELSRRRSAQPRLPLGAR